jgi:ABC-type multidrug transport system fused ATPase/permease subunit
LRESFGRYAALLRTYARPHWRKVLLLATLLLSSIALQLVSPQVLRTFIDAATTGAGEETLTGAALLFLGVALLQQAIAVTATYVGQDVAWSATNALRADLALHCMRLDLSFHNQRTPGELIERIDGDVTALANFFSAFVIQLAGSALLLVGVIAVLSFEQWQAGLGFAAFVLLTLLVLQRVRPLAAPHWRATRQASAELSGYLEERLAGTEDIRSSGASDYALLRLYQLLRALLAVSRKANTMGGLVISTTLTMFAVGTGVSLGLGAWLYHEGLISIGTVYMLFFYSGLITTPLRQITDQLQDLQRATASIGRIDELLRTASRISDGEATLPTGPLAVAFEGVTFSYADERDYQETRRQGDARRETREIADSPSLASPSLPLSESDVLADSPPINVLENISFSLAPGERLGLLGRTGSGKSTIARLLLRFYDPQEGAILLGGADLRSIATEDLRRRIGVVTQEVQLFHASVRNNLTLFNAAIADERVLEAIRLLGLEAWYDALPGGLDTTLTSGGGGLSAGEAQLVALVRVFLKDPGLVILDEASARLDPATERRIERAIDLLLRDRTAIIIAHRLATVLRADTILILENGRVAELGPRAQLQRSPDSRFAALLRLGLETLDDGPAVPADQPQEVR